MKLLDLTGQKFGRLTVSHRAENAGATVAQACPYDLGAETTQGTDPLRRGKVVSCGCHRRAATRAALTTHSMSRTPEYCTWGQAKQRVTNPKNPRWDDYGGRGIEMCSEWLASFEAFYAYMGPRPAGASIDRIDVDGNYEPGNCRWATAVEQARNKRGRRG